MPGMIGRLVTANMKTTSIGRSSSTIEAETARSVARSADLPAESMVRSRKRSPARKKTARLISQPGAADQTVCLMWSKRLAPAVTAARLGMSENGEILSPK